MRSRLDQTTPCWRSGPATAASPAHWWRGQGRVVAIEKDHELVPSLEARLPGGVKVIEGDALDSDWHGPAFRGRSSSPEIFPTTSPHPPCSHFFEQSLFPEASPIVLRIDQAIGPQHQ